MRILKATYVGSTLPNGLCGYNVYESYFYEDPTQEQVDEIKQYIYDHVQQWRVIQLRQIEVEDV